MDRCRIHGGGNVHELEAEGAARHADIANVAHKGDVGIVDRDIEIGLIVEAGGLIGAGGARSFFVLRGKRLAAGYKARGRKERRTGHQMRLCWTEIR